MSKCPEVYDNFNPKLVLSHENHLVSTNVHMEVYKEDGSPNRHQFKSEDVIADKLRNIFDAIGPIEMRDLIHLTAAMNRLVSGSVRHAMNELHQFIHEAKLPDAVDEDTLCESLGQYLKMPEEPQQPTEPEPVSEVVQNMLRDFFPSGKPN